jgi:hypothetical protein
MAGSCENGNETSGSIKLWEFLEKLTNYQLVKKDSAVWVKHKWTKVARKSCRP